MTADLVVRNIGAVVTPIGPAPRLRNDLGALLEIPRAALAVRGGRLSYVGPESELPPGAVAAGAPVLDAEGALALPGFVDAHTHLAYAGDRDAEIRQRLAGATYSEIAAAGGGIVRSVAATRSASAEALQSLLRARLDEMILCGTTTAEIKSGYGLETAAEIRSLEAIRRVAATHPVGIISSTTVST
jgi:imidazolonepropionase